jgi:hypothetical protein
MTILVEPGRQPVLRDGLTAAGTQTDRLQMVAVGRFNVEVSGT